MGRRRAKWGRKWFGLILDIFFSILFGKISYWGQEKPRWVYIPVLAHTAVQPAPSADVWAQKRVNEPCLKEAAGFWLRLHYTRDCEISVSSKPVGFVTPPELVVLMLTQGLWADWSSVQISRGKSSPMRWQSPCLGPRKIKLISKAWGRRNPWQQRFGKSELPCSWPALSFDQCMSSWCFCPNFFQVP